MDIRRSTRLERALHELTSGIKRLPKYAADDIAGEVDNLLYELTHKPDESRLDPESDEANVLRLFVEAVTARYFELERPTEAQGQEATK